MYRRAVPRELPAALPRVPIAFSLPYPPSANRYWRTDRGGLPHISDEARAYKAKVRKLCLGLRPIDGSVSVEVAVYRPQKSGDLDNRLKVTLDALRGIAFHDDSQVVELHARRHDDKANPRVEVSIATVP